MVKRELTIVVLVIFALILFSVFGISKILSFEPTTIKHSEYTVEDSLRSEISFLQIENGRYQIIIDRIYELDSNLVNKANQNLE